jgi:hypothetical protein
MKMTVFWDVAPCCLVFDQHFRGAYYLHHQGHLGDLDIDGRTILKWILRTRVWTGFIWLRIVFSAGCEHGNEDREIVE